MRVWSVECKCTAWLHALLHALLSTCVWQGPVVPRTFEGPVVPRMCSKDVHTYSVGNGDEGLFSVDNGDEGFAAFASALQMIHSGRHNGPQHPCGDLPRSPDLLCMVSSPAASSASPAGSPTAQHSPQPQLVSQASAAQTHFILSLKPLWQHY